MKPKFFLPILTLCLAGCTIIGVNFKVHNPRKPAGPQKFTEEQIVLGELNEYRTCYDVYYYDFALDVNPDEKHLKGKVEMHARATTAFSKIQIDLDQHFEILSLVDKDSGVELAYTRNQRAIYVDLSKEESESFVIEITYQGKPIAAKKAPWKGGFVWDEDENKNPFVGVACESDGASIWWPLKDHTSDEPDSMRLHYTVPEGLVAVGNGQFESDFQKEGKHTYNWFISYPINTYNVTIYVGKYQLIEDEYIGVNGESLEINHYVLPENYTKAKRHFRQLGGIIESFEKSFGPYPWYRDGFKLVESPYAGMEHQTAIAYGNGYKNDLGDVDYIILHETAHEWWGNSVTATDLADVWLQEGFATYSEALYFEDKDGYLAYEDHLLWTRIMIKNKYPVVGVKDRRCFHFRKNSDVYGKGAWILHSLRCQIGDDATFFDIIKTFYADYAYGLADSDDFIRLVNQKTGISYEWFFEQYLYINEVPELEYNVIGDNFFYRWANMPNDFSKMKMIFIDEEKDSTVFYPTTRTAVFKIPVDEYGGYEFEIAATALYVFDRNKKLGFK